MSTNQTTNSEPTWDQIARRAYEIYLDQGRPEGRSEEHWALAQSQLNNGLSVKVLNQKKKRLTANKNRKAVLQP